jgi:hypothetical protein
MADLDLVTLDFANLAEKYNLLHTVLGSYKVFIRETRRARYRCAYRVGRLTEALLNHESRMAGFGKTNTISTNRLFTSSITAQIDRNIFWSK